MTKKGPIYRWRFALLQRYRNKTLPTLVILLGDLLLYAVAFSIGEIFYIWGGNGLVWSELYSKLLLTLMLTTLSFIAIGTHRTILRHFGINDIGKLLLSVALPAIVLYILRIVALSYPFIDLALLPGFTEITLTYALLFLFMVLYRLASQQIYNDLFRRHGIEQHVLIYGAGAAGIIACNALKQDLRQDYIIDAYIDDDKSKYGQKINGIRVCSADEALNERYVAEHRVQTLIIAMPTVKTDKRQAIIGRGLDLGLTVKSVPHINTWINHTFQSNQIESIKIEDLLEREVIHVNESSMRESIANKVVLVTGAAGSIGSEICRQLTGLNPRQIVMLDIAESAIYDLQYELRNSEPYKAMADRMVFLIADVRDRQRLAEDGILIAIVGLEPETGLLVSGPDIVTRGFVYVKESDEMLEEAKGIAFDVVESCLDKNAGDWNRLKSAIKEALGEYVWKKTKRRPMILPIITEAAI